MNPQLLQMLLPYLLQLFQGQGGSNPLGQMFGQNAQNAFAGQQQQQQPTAQTGANASNMLQPVAPTQGPGNTTQPVSGGVQAPSGVVGTVPSPQNGISPTGAPQSMNEIWNSLLAGLQNNSLGAPAAPTGGNAGFSFGG